MFWAFERRLNSKISGRNIVDMASEITSDQVIDDRKTLISSQLFFDFKVQSSDILAVPSIFTGLDGEKRFCEDLDPQQTQTTQRPFLPNGVCPYFFRFFCLICSLIGLYLFPDIQIIDFLHCLWGKSRCQTGDFEGSFFPS